MENSTCESCKYYDEMTDKTGYCHANPPYIVVKDRKGEWPVVEPKDWCGQYKPKNN